MRRLFSTFPSGWPGVGLLLQRTLTCVLLGRLGIGALTGTSFSPSMVPQIVGACVGILLLVGLWTPIMGSLIAVIEVWIAMTQVGDASIPILLASLGGTIAMIGPGEWSIDARLFGRQLIDI